MILDLLEPHETFIGLPEYLVDLIDLLLEQLLVKQLLVGLGPHRDHRALPSGSRG